MHPSVQPRFKAKATKPIFKQGDENLQEFKAQQARYEASKRLEAQAMAENGVYSNLVTPDNLSRAERFKLRFAPDPKKPVRIVIEQQIEELPSLPSEEICNKCPDIIMEVTDPPKALPRIDPEAVDRWGRPIAKRSLSESTPVSSKSNIFIPSTSPPTNRLEVKKHENSLDSSSSRPIPGLAVAIEPGTMEEEPVKGQGRCPAYSHFKGGVYRGLQCYAAWHKFLAAATSRLEIVMFRMTDLNYVDTIARACESVASRWERGCIGFINGPLVSVVLDRSGDNYRCLKQLHALQQHPRFKQILEVRVWSGVLVHSTGAKAGQDFTQYSAQLHAKIARIDEDLVMTGSANMTGMPPKGNGDVLQCTSSRLQVAQYGEIMAEVFASAVPYEEGKTSLDFSTSSFAH